MRRPTELLHNELTQCELWDRLGATEAPPRVLGTGDFQCDGQPWNGLGALADFTYSGPLARQYVGALAALRDDYDIVLFCTRNWGGRRKMTRRAMSISSKSTAGASIWRGSSNSGKWTRSIA